MYYVPPSLCVPLYSVLFALSPFSQVIQTKPNNIFFVSSAYSYNGGTNEAEG
jgi:hypothetical protein